MLTNELLKLDGFLFAALEASSMMHTHVPPQLHGKFTFPLMASRRLMEVFAVVTMLPLPCLGTRPCIRVERTQMSRARDPSPSRQV